MTEARSVDIVTAEQIQADAGILWRLEVSIPAEEVDAQEREMLRHLREKLPPERGFRPHRMTDDLLRRRYGKRIRAEAVSLQADKHATRAMEEIGIPDEAQILFEGLTTTPDTEGIRGRYRFVILAWLAEEGGE